MIKKLRMKLVIAAMISLLVVLTAIIGTVSILNYRNIISEADQKLQMLVENHGIFPEETNHDLRPFSPEMPFETRYFSVTLNEDQSVQSTNIGRIASVNLTQAEAYATEVLSRSSSSGFVDTYRFLVYHDTNGTTQICFLSCHRELESFQRFLRNSILVSLIGSLAVLCLLILTSQRIVKPVSESYEKQKRFITDAGHELKTPLTIISADTEVLEMDYGENEWIDDIRSQTSRLADLTNHLVFLARMEEQPQIEFVRFSLSNIMQDVVHDYQTVAKSRLKTLESSIQPDLWMEGDEKIIRRLISIFLDNAMKYTNENGMIRVTLAQWHNQLRMQIYNTTDLISKEALPHLFDRFYRTDSSRNTKTGGFGLGLSIASAIITSHHGKVTASTTDEKSLLITVTFPQA